MRKMLKIATVFVLVMFVFTGCASLFTALMVDPPLDENSSMLVVEMGSNNDYLVNNNFTGWAPLVEDENGNIIVMQMINAIVDAQTIYIAPNIRPGKYTMIGIRHVYTDYGLLLDSDSPNYEPYVERPYHVQQDFLLDESVEITVGQREMVTLGHYNIAYEWNGGGFADKDDRWRVLPSTLKITSDPMSTNVLRAIKGSLSSDTWELWNERNPESPY